MSKTNLARALEGLRDEDPKKFVSLVRMAWPDIKVALERGHSVKVSVRVRILLELPCVTVCFLDRTTFPPIRHARPEALLVKLQTRT